MFRNGKSFVICIEDIIYIHGKDWIRVELLSNPPETSQPLARPQLSLADTWLLHSLTSSPKLQARSLTTIHK